MTEPANPWTEGDRQSVPQAPEDVNDAWQPLRLAVWSEPPRDTQRAGTDNNKPASAEPVKDTRPTLPPIARQLGDAREYKGFSYSGSLHDRLEALRQTKTKVDYKLIVPKESKVAVFGETHPVSESREELVDNMKHFKEMGFTHLAMEALTSQRQPLLDQFYAGKATKQQLTQALQEDWGWDTDSYVALIESAKSNGIKILAVDKKISKEQVAEWHKAGKYTEEHREREKQWAQIIDDQIKKEPDSRVLLLAGKAHVGIDPERKEYLTTLLTQAKLKPLVIDLTATAHETMGTMFEQSVKEAGLQNERFAVPVSQSGFRPSDYIVNLPARPGSHTTRDPLFNLMKALENLPPPVMPDFPPPIFPDIKLPPLDLVPPFKRELHPEWIPNR